MLSRRARNSSAETSRGTLDGDISWTLCPVDMAYKGGGVGELILKDLIPNIHRTRVGHQLIYHWGEGGGGGFRAASFRSRSRARRRERSSFRNSRTTSATGFDRFLFLLMRSAYQHRAKLVDAGRCRMRQSRRPAADGISRVLPVRGRSARHCKDAVQRLAHHILRPHHVPQRGSAFWH